MKPGTVIRVALSWMILCPVLPSPAVDDPVSTRDALDQWMEAGELLSREKQAWRLGRQLLEERIELVQRETRTLEERTAALRMDIGQADETLAGMITTDADLASATAALAEAVTALETRVLALLRRAPAPVLERVRPLSQRMPDRPPETDRSPSERLHNVIGILDELNRFAGELTEVSEVRDLPDGSTAEVSVLYLGLSQAYYCNEKRGVAGVGRPGEDGWVWEARDDLARRVADVLAVFRNEVPAAYIGLPVEVD